MPGHEAEPQRIELSYVFPGSFATWGVAVSRGRDFADGTPPGVIVNETFVSRFLSGKEPLGQMVGVNGCPGRTQAPIVGVVRNHLDRQRAEQVPAIYLPYPQQGALYTTTYAIRTSGDPSPLVSPVRRLLAERGINPDGDVTLGRDYRKRSTTRERLLTVLLGIFSSVALFIACLGIYGMLAYTVTWRTSEIGIRMALGAARPRVVRLILGESIVPVAVGLALGAAIAIALSGFVDRVVFGVSARDPWTIVSVAILFLLTATLAAALPALRASSIDPLPALRHE